MSSTLPLARAARWPTALLAAGAVLVTAATSPATAATKPTVVLVHGAFADGASWSGVTSRLQRRGYRVVTPANPLRGIALDSAYLKSFISTIKGPLVLVGHSYGGTLISNAATGNANVKALVYIAGFEPEQGETISQLSTAIPGGLINPTTTVPRAYPLPNGASGTEITIKPASFRQVFAADLPVAKTKVLGSAQRPWAMSVLTEPSGPPAWHSIPSWALVAGADLAVGTKLERFMAKRAHSTTIELAGASHAVLVSRPGATANLIVRAANATD